MSVVGVEMMGAGGIGEKLRQGGCVKGKEERGEDGALGNASRERRMRGGSGWSLNRLGTVGEEG